MQLRGKEWVGERSSSHRSVRSNLGESPAAWGRPRTLLVADDWLKDHVARIRWYAQYMLEDDVWIEMHARGLTGRYTQYERQDCENDAGRGEYLARTIMNFYHTKLTRARVLARLKE